MSYCSKCGTYIQYYTKSHCTRTGCPLKETRDSSDVLIDMATGYAIGKIIESAIDAFDSPKTDTPVFESGGGGDFGGAGAGDSWGSE